MTIQNAITTIVAIVALAVATAAMRAPAAIAPEASSAPTTTETVARAAPPNVSPLRNPTGSAPADVRYVVQYGDTLWGIAERYYQGDVVRAMERIKRRNGLRRDKVLAGEELVLPSASRP